MFNRLRLTLAAALIVSASYSAEATSTTGLAKKTTTIEAQTIDTYRITHYGGLPAQLRFKSYGETFLEVVVRDEDGVVVASGNDSRNEAVLLTWLPSHTQIYTIRVFNKARVSNVYFISTN